MKIKKDIIILAIAAAGLVAAPSLLKADEGHKEDKNPPAEKADKKAKPYPLDTCLVSEEKLGEHGKPYVFTHEGQEIKLCCKDCLKDFKKEPAKYTAKLKIADTEKK